MYIHSGVHWIGYDVAFTTHVYMDFDETIAVVVRASNTSRPGHVCIVLSRYIKMRLVVTKFMGVDVSRHGFRIVLRLSKRCISWHTSGRRLYGIRIW